MTLFSANSTAASTRGSAKKLFGYEVLHALGEGAGSAIYAVRDVTTGGTFALKHVVRKADKDVRFVEQLEAEHEVGQKVRHPALRRTFDLKISRSMFLRVNEAVLVMELFEGRPLEFRIPRTTIGIVEVAIQTARALESLHSLGYIHCDLKPNNILIGEKGDVKVIDLGQAAKTGTAKSRIQGTPDYIAPEQVKCQPVTFRTDVFNFGATFYWALTGQKLPTLFTLKKGDNSLLVDDLLPTPRKINPLIPEPLSNLIMECVRTQPLKRPATIGDVAGRLEVVRHVIARDAAAAAAVPRPANAVVA